MRKIDMAEQARKAAEAGDRFSRAEAVLDQRPTAFHQPSRDSAGLVSSGVQVSGDNRNGRFERIPVDLIDANPYNARRIYRPQRIGELSESIVANGQMQPGIATVREGGRYVLVAGHYRLAAIRQAGLPTMDVMVHDGLSDRDLFEYSYRENSERDSQSALDDAMAWREMLDRKVYPNETALAGVVRKSLANVNRTLSILKLSAPLLDLVGQNPEAFPMSCLSELVLLEAVAGTKTALVFAEKVGQGEIGRKEIIEARTRIETPKSRKRKEISRQYKIHVADGTEIGALKEWKSGRVSLDVVVSSSADRVALVNELKRRFSIGDA